MSKEKCSVEVFSRVTGFFRPVQSWNKGKTEEFKDRKRYTVDEAMLTGADENCRVTETISG
ncbi:MAG: anaerobic ribonucleoside-triphosphate reductase [Candidatus Omnitrophota bacterium]|nr:anaerobic ribonucleoside-triphosphate reductase [Candidatus Omnitrophota bacterium]